MKFNIVELAQVETLTSLTCSVCLPETSQASETYKPKAVCTKNKTCAVGFPTDRHPLDGPTGGQQSPESRPSGRHRGVKFRPGTRHNGPEHLAQGC